MNFLLDAWASRCLSRAWSILLGILLLVPIGVMLAIFPVGFIWESIDLVRMRATTEATIESVRVESGGKFGATRPAIEYTYAVGGATFRSDKFSPGFLSRGSWTGGGAAVSAIRPGDKRTSHYEPGNPQNACLFYGWHKFTLLMGSFITSLAAPLLLGIRALWRIDCDIRPLFVLSWFVPCLFAPSVVPPMAVFIALPVPFVLLMVLMQFPFLCRLFRKPQSRSN